MKTLCIYGCGGQGRDIAELALKNNTWDEIVFVDDNPKENIVNDFKVYNLKDILIQYSKEQIEFIISIGEPSVRKSKYEVLERCKFKLGVLHDLSVYKTRKTIIGEGCIIHHGVVVSSNTLIGKCSFINKNSVIGHDVIIGDFCVVSPSVTIGGFTTIGSNCYLGSGAIIRNDISIGENSIIGMGSVVLKDVEPNSVVAGNPARFVRFNKDKKVFKK
jgi:sugar O-acyltransferase (sialic acid O-acetyltransferase NeuD family)